ncbi:MULTISPECIES: c-type cytochrome [unclassified Variovorax]|uniref:c-type cytochrome n=1 Tax=unclassified Variovorax TaxID=663243 RepID=UPI00210BCF41|nr:MULTISPECIES: c-type cytochrome [unclassified Variovorax]
MKPTRMRRSPRTAPIALALLLGAATAPALANQALASKYSCLACHAAATKLVGPAYKDVAAKYKDDNDAVATLVKSIRNGGSGRWGDMAMPPQPQVSEADAKKLAEWILGGAK